MFVWFVLFVFFAFFTERITVLQDHHQQIEEALVAYDEALETGDPSNLGDNVLRPISSVASDSDILLSPGSDRNKVNGGASHFSVIFPVNLVILDSLFPIYKFPYSYRPFFKKKHQH